MSESKDLAQRHTLCQNFMYIDLLAKMATFILHFMACFAIFIAEKPAFFSIYGFSPKSLKIAQGQVMFFDWLLL